MTSDTTKFIVRAQLLRLLFKYNLVPRSHADELAFLLELNAILEI